MAYDQSQSMFYGGGLTPGGASGFGGLGVGLQGGLRWLTGKHGPTLPGYEENNQLIGDQMGGRNPFVGADPYGGDYAALIEQLRSQMNPGANGLAEQQYRRASADNFAQQQAMARGGRSYSAGRQAAQGLGQINQGMASGLAEAGTRERMGAAQTLGGVLQGASGADFARQNANSQAWLQLLAAKLGLSAQQLQALMGQKTGMEQLGGLLQSGAQAWAITHPGKPKPEGQ